MPDEFDFKDYKSMEEYSKTLEGTKYLHSLYLRAVNNPIRREILTIVNESKQISKKDLLELLIDKNILEDVATLNYNIDYLIKAFCISEIKDNNEIYYEITQSGQVVEYLE